MTEKKGKEKGKKKPDDLELILASVKTLTAKVIKLVEEFAAFKKEESNEKEGSYEKGAEEKNR